MQKSKEKREKRRRKRKTAVDVRIGRIGKSKGETGVHHAPHQICGLISRVKRQKPREIYPEVFQQRKIIIRFMVEAPGLEPGSEKQITQASTSLVCDLSLTQLSPAGGIHLRQLVFVSPWAYERCPMGNPALVTPESGLAG
jgi:hypothetical protein